MSSRTPDGFLLLDAPEFTLRDEPALSADCAQHTAFDNLLTETTEQLFL
jgi:ABC-type cobalamin transport system ATPase subunit